MALGLLGKAVVGSGGASSVSIANIPDTANSLLVYASFRADTPDGTTDSLRIELENDLAESAVVGFDYVGYTQSVIDEGSGIQYYANANSNSTNFTALALELFETTTDLSRKNGVLRYGHYSNGSQSVDYANGFGVATSSVGSRITKVTFSLTSNTILEGSTFHIYGLG